MPRFPGVTSALGCVVADMRHDRVQTVNRLLSELDAAELGSAILRDAEETRAVLGSAGVGFSAIDRLVELDMLYLGQTHTVGVPLEIAMSVEQLKEAVERLSECDVILIDTAGRSQRDASRISQLKAFFAAVRPHEVHLVLSSAASQRVLDQTIERFRDIGIDRLIFTKLDEALGFGVILNSLQKAQAKLSYVTTGQDVPSDIEVGEPETLAQLILANDRAA